MLCYIPPRRAAPHEPHEGRSAAEDGNRAEPVRVWGDESAGGAPHGAAWYGLALGGFLGWCWVD